MSLGMAAAVDQLTMDLFAEPAAITGPAFKADVFAPVQARFRPVTQIDLAPTGAKARVAANLAALDVLAALRTSERPPSTSEQQILGRWSGWGAVPQIFDDADDKWRTERERLLELLRDKAYRAARASTVNAHYTDVAYIKAVWAALARLGFQGGRVLEPGCGVGTFIGRAPARTQMIGIELDPTTAAIAAALHPNADIRAESFADTTLPDAYFDATIGNVPFADVVLHDPVHNRGRHTMHNHFILKALQLTRPGGLVAVLTSHWTLDSDNDAARREMFAFADLTGAIRLPSGAHRRAAGTDVVTDLVILRRRGDSDRPGDDTWIESREVTVDDEPIRISAHYVQHPDRLLGVFGTRSGPYGPVMDVRGTDTARRLDGALRTLTTRARRVGLTMVARAGDPPIEERSAEGLWERHITAMDDGSFRSVVDSMHVELRVSAGLRVELRALLNLRDLATRLLDQEVASDVDTPAIINLRAELRSTYQAYLARYGPINRFKLRPTGRLDKTTGEPRMARQLPRVMAVFRQDPFYALVRALEVFDDETQSVAEAALLTRRVVVARTVETVAATAADAVAMCMESRGRVDVEHVAGLLGEDMRAASAHLAGLVFRDPDTDDELVPAAEYLSGNVRAKLDAARRAAGADSEYHANVTALEAVIPPDIGLQDIQARLGAAWIDAPTHEQFLREILGDRTVQVEHPGGTIWEVRGLDHTVAAASEWGTRRMGAITLAKTVLEQRPVRVTDKRRDVYVVNAEETAAAVEKADALQERFGEWVWEDVDRAARLLAEYNRRFNSLVLRDYTDAGERLTLPGVAADFTPHPHQRTAVARMIGEPAVGLFHAVGAGKTSVIAMGCSELKRLGLISKPVVVIPNHMLEQFAREWMQIYPLARLLAASSRDLAGAKRRDFVARVAANDWDAVIMTYSSFERVGVSVEVQERYVEREISAMRAMLHRSEGGHGLAVKRIEKMIMTAEERLKDRMDAVKDHGVNFEKTGLDYVACDEAHSFKNLRTASNIRDAAIEGSKRASDLHMKTEYLREQHGRRVITFATATPIANSITEAHVTARYLRPDLLEDAGVLDFDAWAATFGQTVTQIEMAPTGGGNYRMATRFARFQNVPEMLRIWMMFADVQTAEDLNLPVPLLEEHNGVRGPRTIVIPASPEVAAYVKTLGERAEKIQHGGVDPKDDNMLVICTDGRSAALDLRMVTGEPSSTECKLDRVAATITRIWQQTRDNRYVDPITREPSLVPGALQIVFADTGTPRETWNGYDELRDQLVGGGIPRDKVRFIHEARDDKAKARLFAACRDGQVSVIIGSTSMMGVGTNIQARAVALHHVDCPWRPADIEQRDGRMIRQGNQNPEVGIYRFVVAGSFDAYSWQTLERKAAFIAQVTRGKLDVREIEDIGDNALSFAEVKALASGDPLLLDKAAADAELTRLSRLYRAHQRNESALHRTVAAAVARVARCDRELAQITDAGERLVDTRGKAFAMTVGDERVTVRADAAVLIEEWARPHADRGIPFGRSQHELGELGELGGIRVDARLVDNYPAAPILELVLAGLPVEPAHLSTARLREASLLIRHLERMLGGLHGVAERLARDITAIRGEGERALDGLAVPFKHADALTAASARAEAIRDEMQRRQAAADREDDKADEPAAKPTVQCV